jgi:hypothetical protein
VSEHPAGTKLDLLIAKRVMGDRYKRTAVIGGFCMVEPPLLRGLVRFQPSTDDALAIVVFGRIARWTGEFQFGDGYAHIMYADGAGHGSFKNCDPPYPVKRQKLDDDQDHGCWSCHFHVGILGENDESPRHWVHGDRFCARGGTLALAICRAALKAVTRRRK